MRLSQLSMFGLLLAAVTGGCTIAVKDQSHGNKINAIKTNKTTSSGDFHMSGRLGINNGNLGITLAAIRDPDTLTAPVPGSKVTFSVSVAAKNLTCTVGQVSTAAGASVDLVFINDTTGSMSGTVKGVADSVDKFATDIAGAGIDAKFSMYTFGDAYATKSKSDTLLVIGQGDYDVPTFDPTARPYIPLGDVGVLKSFLNELKADTAILGVGGGDEPENGIGAIQYANSKVAWRDGAAHEFVFITDAHQHTKGDGSSFPGFDAPDANSVAQALAGEAVVHALAHDKNDEPNHYNPKKIADDTGGAFIDLPADGNADLSKLNLKDWLTNSFSGVCTDATTGNMTITIKATVTGTKAYVGNLTFDVTIS